MSQDASTPSTQDLLQTMEALQRAKEEGEEAKAQAEAILGNIGEGLIVTDAQGKITIINRAAGEMLGLNTEMLNHEFAAVIPMKDSKEKPLTEAHMPHLLALRQQRKVTASLIFVTRKNTLLPVAVTATPIIRNGDVEAAVVIFRDMTKERELDKLKDEFVSIASHELRTPMAAMKGLVSMILEGDYGPIPDLFQQPVRIMGESTNQLLRLVNDMLNVSRIEAGRMQFLIADCDLNRLIESIIDRVAPLAKKKGLLLTVSPAPKIIVQADTDKVREILINLLDNAMKFTDSGSITLTATTDGKTAFVRVTDTGIGIAAEDQKKLFGKFQQVNAQQRTQPQGTGLGLYISREFTRKMGGELWVEQSEPGKGSTFTLTLPIKESNGL